MFNLVVRKVILGFKGLNKKTVEIDDYTLRGVRKTREYFSFP